MVRGKDECRQHGRPAQMSIPKRLACSSAQRGLSNREAASDKEMAKTCKNVIRLLEDHPDGIPLSQLAVFYSQRYHRNLIVADLGFNSISAFISSLSDSLVVREGKVFHRSPKTKNQDSEEMVELLKSCPEGIPLNKLAVAFNQRYKRNITLSALGFSSMAIFIDSLSTELHVKDNVVYHRSHTTLPGADKDKISQDVVELVKDDPHGIPLKKLAVFYAQKYKQNLILAELGFSSVGAFVDSLSKDLLVENENVFHRTHKATPRPSAALSKTPPPLTSTFGISFGASSAPKEDDMTHRELLEKVKEVIRVYPAAGTSITQLQNGYFLHFGAVLPLKLYMSLYDSHANKQKASPCQPLLSVQPEPGGSATTPAKTVTKVSVSPQPTLVANGLAEKVVRSKTGSPLQVKSIPAAASPVTSSSASLEDFPVLGTRLSRSEQRRLKENHDASTLVFHSAHHAQLREVHGANVRAVEALEEEEEEGSVGRRRRRVMDPDNVNNLVEDAIRAIAVEGEHVTVEKVISKVCMLLQVPSLFSVRIDPNWQLPAVKELKRTIKEINLFIQSVEAVYSICTLYELGQAIASLKNKKRFEELHLGPLCKFPLVHRMFKIDSSTKDDDIQQIETVDILRSLRNFRRNRNRTKVDLAEFMQYLADQYNCDSPYELGIRIQSVGLPISTLAKAYNCENACMDKAREVIQKEIEEDVQARLFKIKKSLLEPAQGAPLYSSTGNLELRKKYANLTAAEAVMEVFTNSMGIFNNRMTKWVQDFLMYVSGDRLARTLFQLAVCGGSLAVPSDLVPKEKPQKQSQEKKPSEEMTSEAPPTEAAVKQYFKECMSNFIGTVTLPYLCRLEKKVVEHFKFKEFRQLQQGSFLEFLLKNTQVLQDATGGIVAINNQDVRACGFRPNQQDVYEFIKQCGEGDPSRLPFIEAALRSQYRIRDSRELGYGHLRTLLDFAKRQRELSGEVISSAIRYECPLLPKDPGDGLGETVGLLGEVSREQAIASLLTAPLLQDLREWSQWELVFQPNHGPLKDFIDKYCGNTDLLALEVSPGVMLRITSATSDKLFSEAAQALDPVGTAGHLVSIVVADGISNTPTALLANHMEDSLAQAVAQEDLYCDENGSFSTAANFVLECVSRMPTRICKELLQQVFLEPLSKVIGQAKSKTILLDAAKSETRYLNKLHQMGILLGITEWARDFHTKLILPAPPEVPSHIATSVAADSLSDRSSSMLSLPDSEDLLEDSVLSAVSGSSSSSPAKAPQQGIIDSARSDDQDDDGDDDLFELASEENEENHSSAESKGENDEDGAVEESPDPTEGAETNEHFSQCRVIIEDIRKSEFGIGVELNEEGQNLMRKHQARLGRSLERLSTELYSKDTHFVLELIQNADDNSYLQDDPEQPAVAFVVQRDCITILNNECGFEEKNVRAICDVGKSTKGKHICGYIGQKGIGFKSVFKVTDCPEIHSNDFHIRFDKASGPMGYILPHWVAEDRHLHCVAKEIAEKSWTTKIFLPLRSDNYQTKNLFHDVHPSLLLFLHRLRSITIYNEAEKRLVSMTRRDLSHNILEVDHTGGVERWLVVKKMLYPKKIKDDVESTELALAFQLSDGFACDVKVQPPKQPVFAFLPLRSFGFRFIVQGDFDIPSSREDVDRDSSWNQWLRSEIPQLFLQAMEVFNKHPEFSGLRGLCHFLQFIPQPSEILDFFNPVANQIIQLLKGKAFLPAKEDSEGRVEFRLPSQVAVCQDPLIQEVIAGEDLCKHLNLSYLHPTLQLNLSQSLVTALGIHRLRAPEITTVICAMARSLTQHGDLQSDSGLQKLAKLLACNFRALELEYGEVDDLLQTLRDVPVVPLADGRVVALSAEGVFFPLNEKKKTYTGLGALYKDLSIVEPRLLSCLDELGNSQVRELLRRLQVHELEPQQVLQQHIYPALKSTAWKAKSKDITVSYLVFIKQHSQEQEYRALRAAIPVLTNKGFLCPSHSKVQFSKEYDNIDLPTKLPGVDWVLLDPCYLRSDGDVSGWRELFSELGVRDLLIFRKERRTLTSTELSSSPWAAEGKLWPKPADGVYVIEDQQCEEFHSLATAVQLPTHIKLQQRQTLINLLERNWDTGEKYAQYLRAQVLDSQGQTIRDTKSSFYHFLTRLTWVPSYRPVLEGGRTVDYLCPNTVYLFSDSVHSLLGAHVHYIDLTPSEFSRAIGMRHSVGVDEMVDYLKRWCTKVVEGNETGEAEGADFITSVQHIHAVYCYLQAECSSAQLKDLFQHSPAVFIEYDRKEDCCSGRFYHLKDVCWSDPTAMFVRYKELIRRPESGVQEPKVLAPFYIHLQHMKEMFLSLNVERSPSMKQYVDLLEVICESTPLPTGEVLQDISVIFARLAEKCKRNMHGEQDEDFDLDHYYCRSLKEMVSRKRVFPTKTQSWVTLARKPMIADSQILEKIFKSHSEVCLLNLPSPVKKAATNQTNKHKSSGQKGKLHASEEKPAFSERDRELFLEICGVKRLTQCVTTEAQTENYRPCPTMQALVHDLVPYIQRFIYHHEELGEIYEDLKESGIAQEIKSLSFGQVGKLYIYYRLEQPDESPIVESEDIICLLKDRKELYIQKDHQLAKLDICRELVKLFTSEKNFVKELDHFLEGLVMCIHDEANLRRFLDRKGILELPVEEETWEVPAPVVIKPEPMVPSTVRMSGAVNIQEVEEKTQEDEDDKLHCWPPKASLSKGGGSSTGAGNQAVEAVMKMWPPPAPPTSSAPTASPAQRSSGADRSSSNVNTQEHTGDLQPQGAPPGISHVQEPRSHCAQHSAGPTEQRPEGPVQVVQCVNGPHEPHAVSSGVPVEKPDSREDKTTKNSVISTAAEQRTSEPSQQAHNPIQAPEMVASQFQSGSLQRPPMSIDSAVWTKPVTTEAVLEDLVLDCSLPQSLQLLEDYDDTAGIGKWGEQLVYSFLTHWRESGSGPREITWYNQIGESGQPCDFKLTFANGQDGMREVYVEVKTTVKREKHFIHLSANELDLALREKENYHIYRVYSAGDSQSVRLCRIKNLAQHLHSKTLELFLFV
ncbi:protein NO VEIN isoform X1 [Pygocentrus nattereri]|uniref:Wu:fj29h11 n=2 Tax=Pygocentrus nattereri TaxID=42514 RepID=A0A3B4E8H9_PYGNA|nr:protein NO VEIN isoform X1 [Pygocentrus nattereri]